MNLVYKFSRDLFIISFLLFFLLLIIEDFQPDWVSFWFNPGYILAVSILSGLISLITCQK